MFLDQFLNCGIDLTNGDRSNINFKIFNWVQGPTMCIEENFHSRVNYDRNENDKIDIRSKQGMMNLGMFMLKI